MWRFSTRLAIEVARDEKNKDTAGLGDWCVNTAKLPHGLGWLADEAGRRGLRFGLWVEPEMANTNSWLYMEHPDWILREARRPLVCGRGKTQVILDFANPAVRDDLFSQLDFTESTPLRAPRRTLSFLRIFHRLCQFTSFCILGLDF